MTDPGWYTLQIPEDALAFGSFDRVELWQEIAGALLKKYTERYYFFSKREWELPHLEYRILDEGDPNFLAREPSEEAGYRITVDASEEEVVQTLSALRDAIDRGEMKDVDFRGLKTIWFDRHLYQPLLHLERGTVEVSPVPLNRGEKTLVKDLRRFCDDNEGFLEDKELYLLRNLSRGRGVGFFEAGNFHPDFILWLVVDGHQYVTFIDPKGIRQLSLNDPKINFHRTIKELEERLGDPRVTLNSFIVSSTDKQAMLQHWNVTEAELAERHVLFQEDRYSYVETIISELMEIPGAV